jgi:hypothetical protein
VIGYLENNPINNMNKSDQIEESETTKQSSNVTNNDLEDNVIFSIHPNLGLNHHEQL